ncbi:unnamed protein product [Phytomonas sp. EM1]|nr:unnamed protein product [Phytomonas sp. EM1]|eukprot:CCW65774.1 unnamed protein product [Phytomonas sp. isolate EM1]
MCEAPRQPHEAPNVAACLEENRKILESIYHLHGEAPGGVAGVLEGKYLAQLQKTRALAAQLEGERARVRELYAKLEEKGGAGGSSEGRALKAEEGAAGLKERLQRAHAQLRERDRQAVEQKREIHQLRQLLAREVGKSMEEVNAWIRGMGVVNEGGETPTPGGGGWRGRAEQIVLLQVKVKDLERRLNEDGKGDGKEREKEKDRVKDVDAEARDRVASIHGRRLRAARELAAELDAARRSLEEGKMKHLALQARYGTVQQECSQLRAHLSLLLEKSRRDDELIERYREERKETKPPPSRPRPPPARTDEKKNDQSDANVEKSKETTSTAQARVLFGLQEMNVDLLERNRILEEHLLALTLNEEKEQDENESGERAVKSRALLLTWVMEACGALGGARDGDSTPLREENSEDLNARETDGNPSRESRLNDEDKERERNRLLTGVSPRAVAAVLHHACAHVAFVEEQALRREPLERVYRGWVEKIRQEWEKKGGGGGEGIP